MIKSVLPIGTIVKYKNIDVEIVGFSDNKYYVIQPVGESPYYQRIVRYNDEKLGGN